MAFALLATVFEADSIDSTMKSKTRPHLPPARHDDSHIHSERAIHEAAP